MSDVVLDILKGLAVASFGQQLSSEEAQLDGGFHDRPQKRVQRVQHVVLHAQIINTH